jgi:hypothetical protein
MTRDRLLDLWVSERGLEHRRAPCQPERYVPRKRLSLGVPPHVPQPSSHPVLPNHPTTPLASGAINTSGDTLSVELVEPNQHPSVIMIRWPDHATIVQTARFNAVAAEIMRLLASAVTAYNQRKARRL